MLQKLLNFLLPPTCVLCRQPSQRALDLCLGCEHDLPWLEELHCQRCGLILTHAENPGLLCNQCYLNPPAFNRLLAPWYYEQPLSHLITLFKFRQQLSIARLLSALLLQHLSKFYQDQAWPECIIPMPLHAQRLRERGYNQAVELARPLAKKLHLPLELNCCQRSQYTSAQSSLSVQERAHNIDGVFRLAHPIAFSHIAIVDDVVTTGQTIRELAKVFKQAGVATIDVWACARTQPS